MDEILELFQATTAVRVEKRAIPVPVVFARSDGLCETREGVVRFSKGDALLSGVEGEQWPIGRDTFLAGYRPATDIALGDDGLYLKMRVKARAVQLVLPIDIPAGPLDDSIHGYPGDWLLSYEDGGIGIVGDSIFHATYDRV